MNIPARKNASPTMIQVIFTILSTVSVGACGPDQGQEQDQEQEQEFGSPVDSEPRATQGPGAFSSDFKSNPLFFTLMDAPVAGTSPHGTVQIWYSENIREVLNDTTGVISVPVGTVAIKTGDMDGDTNVDSITVMIKEAPGFDSVHGDWRYEMRSPDGTLMTDEETDMPMTGAIEMCISCHSAASARDYLAGTALR